MNSFFCYGGCVSRDLFNFLDSDEYQVKETIGQNPISSMFEKPIPIPLDEIRVNSNFENRMLYYDLNKIAKSRLQSGGERNI